MKVPSKKNVLKALAQIAVIVFVPGGFIGVLGYQLARWRMRQKAARAAQREPEQLSSPSHDQPNV